MVYKRVGHEILVRQPLGWNAWTHFCFYRNLQAIYNAGEVNISLVKPTIPDTEWQGAIIQEDITATVYIDVVEAGTVDITAGQGVFDLVLDPGTHVVRITAPDCQEVVLEVSV